jgi:hypothetical protein
METPKTLLEGFGPVSEQRLAGVGYLEQPKGPLVGAANDAIPHQSSPGLAQAAIARADVPLDRLREDLGAWGSAPHGSDPRILPSDFTM